MNRSSFALFVALLVHLLLLLIFWFLGTILNDIKKPLKKDEEKKIKISLKEMPKKDKELGEVEKKVEPTPIAPPMPKGSQLKEITKPPVKYEPKKEPKKPKLNPPPEPKPEPLPQPKVEPLPPTKPYIPLMAKEDINTTKEPEKKEEDKKPKDPLYAMLLQDKSSKETKVEEKKTYRGSSIDQNIKELYGDEFGKLSEGQQKYILDNQEIMRRITQQVLERVARVNLPRDLNVNKVNIIEFYLHPNGDMSDFRFLQKSGYYVLDDTTKETIEYAYSRYPRPQEKTLIRYNVFYNLARY